MVDLGDISFDWPDIVEWIKDTAREYGEYLIAILFVVVFVFAGIQKLGRA